MATYKDWDSHSARWKREATRDGLTKSRWNSWLKLSSKSRKTSNPRTYATGVSIADQRRSSLEAAALKNIARVQRGKVSFNPSRISANIKNMSIEDLHWTATATPQQLDAKASKRKVTGYAVNPWWYR